MRYVVELSAQAELALDDIYAYIAKDKPKAAESFVSSLLQACRSLNSFPRAHPLVPEHMRSGDPGEIRYFIHRPYRIVYKIMNGRVFVIDIRHGARQNVE